MTSSDAPTTWTDEDLVQQLQAGEAELAMTQLDLRYGKRIYRFHDGTRRRRDRCGHRNGLHRHVSSLAADAPRRS